METVVGDDRYREANARNTMGMSAMRSMFVMMMRVVFACVVMRDARCETRRWSSRAAKVMGNASRQVRWVEEAKSQPRAARRLERERKKRPEDESQLRS